LVGRAIGLALLLFWATVGVALAATIVIDGQFADWVGQSHATDPPGEVPGRIDMLTFYWATNPGVSNVYFMIQRSYPGGLGNQPVYYRVAIDTDCDHAYNEANDRYILVAYDPIADAGPVIVVVMTGNDNYVSSSGGNWGDPRGPAPDGGTRAEWGVSFADLGISANQQICFFAGSYQNAMDAARGGTPDDRIPASGDITWTPIPALGYPLLALVMVGVIIVVWRQRGRLVWRDR